MENWNKICGFLAIFFLSAFFSSAQVSKNMFFLTKIPVIRDSNFYTIASEPLTPSHPLMAISPNYYTQHFGFFCKQELRVEKTLKMPLRFRLGSIEQCNYLEGKMK